MTDYVPGTYDGRGWEMFVNRRRFRAPLAAAVLGLVGSLVLVAQPSAAAPAQFPLACLDFSTATGAGAAADGEIDEQEAQYIFGLYVFLVGRTPSETEIATWVPLLESGQLLAVSRGIGLSHEGLGHEVFCAYQSILDRNADLAGAAFWTAQLEQGLRYEDLLAILLASPESLAAHSAASSVEADIIAEAYQGFLFRTADQSEIDFWTGQIDGGMSLLDVLLFIAHSEEYGVVQAVNAYDLFLDRSPDAGGGEFWAAYILEHGFSQFAADFLGQPEAYETFFII